MYMGQEAVANGSFYRNSCTTANEITILFFMSFCEPKKEVNPHISVVVFCSLGFKKMIAVLNCLNVLGLH